MSNTTSADSLSKTKNTPLDDQNSNSSVSNVNLNLPNDESNTGDLTADIAKYKTKDTAKEMQRGVTITIKRGAVNEERTAAKDEQKSNDNIETITPADTPFVPDYAISVLIVDKYNGMNKTQAEQLEAKIMDYLDKLILKKLPINPTFYGTSYESKKLKIVCADKFSVNWLKIFIASLRPLWKGAQLEVTLMPSKQQLQPILKLQRPKKPQIVFDVPDGKKRMQFFDIIKHFEKRNPPLKVDSWQLTRKEMSEGGVYHFVDINNESLELIREKGGYLFFQLNTVKIFEFESP